MSQNKTAPKYIILLIAVFFTSVLFFLASTPTYSQTAQELEQIINQKEEELNKQKTYLSEIEKRIKEISSSNYTLSEQINLLDAEISKLQAEISKKDKEIEEKLKSIDEKQKLLNEKKESLDIVSSDLYMRSRYSEGQFLFSFSSLDQVIRSLFIKKNTITTLKEEIEKITGEFQSLVDIKASLEKEKEELDKQKKDLADSYALIKQEKSRVQTELNKQIAERSKTKRTINGLSTELSDLQYQLLLSRQGGTYVNPSSVPSGGDYLGSLEGFLETAPKGSFGVFSIGAYTHRNGMSQWGAKARAENGQNYETILRAYYLDINFATIPTDAIKINVQYCDKVNGYTDCKQCKNQRIKSYDFETDYLYRLGEMPESWNIEALKAQAIAARTYALNATNYGQKTVRGDECGQVIAGQKLGKWKEAVDLTKGIVMQKNGRVFSSQYAAINGGWIDSPSNSIGWDTIDKTGDDSNWISRAWETLSETGRVGTYYWFYKIWYRSGYSVGTSVSSSSCNRTPWLTEEEMADIINAYQVGKSKGWSDSRIIPLKDACHPRPSDNPNTYNPYSHEELKALASKPVSKVYSVVVKNSNGFTDSVIFSTDAGSISMTGQEFKTVYNLRAPGNLRIPQGSGTDAFWHFDIRMK